MPRLNEDDSDRYQLAEKERETIFYEEIRPAIFRNVQSLPNPTAIIFGGQPGSGKSTIVEMIAKKYEREGNCALIIGDELRDYHPAYGRLLQENDKTAAFYTDKDTVYWVEKAIDHAKDIKCNVIIEGTMRVKEKVEQTMLSLRQAGYKIEAHVLAINPLLRWQGVLQRYENQRADRGFGRMTIPEAHKNAYEGMPKTLAHIETQQLADKVVLYKRGAEILYENTLQNGEWVQLPNAKTIVETERNRPWSRQEFSAYIKAADALIALMQQEERQATDLEIKQVVDLKKEACFILEDLQNVAEIKMEVMTYIDKQVQLDGLVRLKNSHLARDPQAAKAYGEQALALDKELKEIARSALKRPAVKRELELRGKEPSATIAESGGFQGLKAKLEQGQLSPRDITTLLRHMQARAQYIDRSRTCNQDRGQSR